MGSLLGVLPALTVMSILVFSIFSVQSETYFTFLTVVPSFLHFLAAPFFGQLVNSEASAGITSRIEYMLCFGTPWFIGFLGQTRILKRRIEEGINPTVESFDPIDALISIMFCFNFLGIYLNRPINGVGQSIYVPIFTLLLSFFSVVMLAFLKFNLYSVQKAVEILFIILFFFLSFNIFFPIVSWSHDSTPFFLDSHDSFRFSPFAKLLNLKGRQSFFATDPETFAIFCLIGFAILIASKNLLRKSIGISLIFIIGSSTQSRLFYLGILLVTVIQFFDKLNYFNKIYRLLILSSLFLLNLLLPWVYASKEKIGLSSLSGRTYIWRVTLDNWSNESILLGHFGRLSLKDFFQQTGYRFKVYHSHNLFLEYLWNWGILGLLLSVSLLLLMIVRALKVESGGFVILCTLMIVGLIEPSLSTTMNSVCFVGVLIFLMYVKFPKQSNYLSAGKD